ncbi:hypothetical protein VaNZ11_002047 [Volvox africanus]|uniref:Phospholipase/carboxylesterase/thioesterase domain-containing protein n=1 Tax=Volvox africanus TaxID=51714 RepID=A0ABQ5RQZ6_9CHLO|nr:hypothetical protein VaNZ11_002047 [Volvox africanus]
MQPAASFRRTVRPTRIITSSEAPGAHPTFDNAPEAPDTAPSLDTGDLIAVAGVSNSSVGKPQSLLVAGGAKRDGFFYVPPTYDPSLPSPMVVMLHGAGGHASPTDSYLTFGGLQNLDASRCILMVPESRGSTWDAIRGSFGPDVAHINRALYKIFPSYPVDPIHVALAGFSDGASYALSLALPNADLFTHVIAFSRGFMAAPAALAAPVPPVPLPGVYISHGDSDAVLPVRCSRHDVPQLRELDCDVTFHKFSGGHIIPGFIAQQGLQWFLKSYLKSGSY